jgi:hypothetical protein
LVRLGAISHLLTVLVAQGAFTAARHNVDITSSCARRF